MESWAIKSWNYLDDFDLAFSGFSRLHLYEIFLIAICARLHGTSCWYLYVFFSSFFSPRTFASLAILQ